MKIVDIYGEVADRLTLVLVRPFAEDEISVDQLERLLDCLTVFLGGLLSEARRNMPQECGICGAKDGRLHQHKEKS